MVFRGLTEWKYKMFFAFWLFLKFDNGAILLIFKFKMPASDKDAEIINFGRSRP